MDIQVQMYVTVGVLGSVILIIITWLAVLSVLLDKLQRTIIRLTSENSSENSDAAYDNYAYRQPNIRSGEELNRRGYSKYDTPVVAPRLQKTAAGMYGDPRNDKSTYYNTPYNSPVTPYATNDIDGTKDASGDFSSVLTKNNGTSSSAAGYPNERNDKSRSVNNGVASVVNQLENRTNYNLPQQRPSQFNNNIMLGPSSSSVGPQQHDDGQPMFFKNRAMNY